MSREWTNKGEVSRAPDTSGARQQDGFTPFSDPAASFSYLTLDDIDSRANGAWGVYCRNNVDRWRSMDFKRHHIELIRIDFFVGYRKGFVSFM